MRFWILVALSSAMVVLLATDGYSILDGGSGLSVDELIDASRGIYHYDSGFPETPQESRRLWSEMRGIDFTMPSKLSESATSAEESRRDYEEAIQDQSASKDSATQTSLSQTASISPSTSIAGNWSLTFEDGKNRIMALRLFQSENVVFGTGTINDGGDTLKILASGSLEGGKLNLDIISDEMIALYRLDLTIKGNSASGEYVAFSTNGENWSGFADGMLTVPK
jgi:hypothetical protein